MCAPPDSKACYAPAVGRNKACCTRLDNQWDVADSGVMALNDYGGPTETMSLASDSPAVDAIADCADLIADDTLPAVDQRGESRPGGGGNSCDIGAVELQ